MGLEGLAVQVVDMAVEILEQWVQAHEDGDTETLERCMDEGFVFEQEGLPQRLDKDEYLDLVEALHRAFPDLGVNIGTESVPEEGLVEWQQSLTATHEQDLDLTGLGLPFFLSTGSTVDLSAETVRTRIQDGRVIEHAIEDPSAGIAGLLEELETGIEEIREEAQDHEPRAPGL